MPAARCRPTIRIPDTCEPEFMNIMPPATMGPGPLGDPPFAVTPLTVVNGRAVLNSHSTRPSLAAYARMHRWWRPKRPRAWNHGDGGGLRLRAGGTLIIAGGWRRVRTCSPVARFRAARPPSRRVLIRRGKVAVRDRLPAEPHSIPPSALPRRPCAPKASALLVGSIPHAAPDFWPMTMTALPLGSVRRIGELPKIEVGAWRLDGCRAPPRARRDTRRSA